MANQDIPKKYFFVIHGISPEMLAAVAYRRSRNPDHEQFRVRKLKCPYCTLPFKAIDMKIKVELFCYPARKPMSIKMKQETCPHCHREVGLHYVA